MLPSSSGDEAALQHDEEISDTLSHVSSSSASTAQSESLKRKREEARKKEEAYRLLMKSEEKKKKRIQEAIEHRMEVEKERVRQEHAEKTMDKLTLLKRMEEVRESEAKKKIQLLQSNAFSVYMSKVDLVKKLTEIEVKERINNLAVEMKKNKTEPKSFDELKQKALQKQKQFIQENVLKHADVAKGTFAYHFEAYTRMPDDQAKYDIDQSMNNHLNPYIKGRHDSILLAHEDSEQIGKKVIEGIIEEKKEQVLQMSEKKILDNHLEKVKKLKYAQDVVRLEQDDIKDLLEIVPDSFETDIGVADSEMDNIRVEIFELEKKRRLYQANHQQQKFDLMERITQSEQKIKNTKSNIHSLQEELVEYRNIKFEKTEEEEKGEISLSMMDKLIIENHEQAKQIVDRSREVVNETKEIILRRKEVEVVMRENEHETHEAENVSNEWGAKVQELIDKETERESNLSALQKKIEKLKDDCGNFVVNFEKRKKETHIKVNMDFSQAVALEDLSRSMHKSKKMYELERDNFLKENSTIMAYLKAKKNALEQRLEKIQASLQKSVDYTSFMKSLTFDSIHLSHAVLSKYMENQKISKAEWANTVQTRATNIAQQSCKPFIEHEKSRNIIHKYLDGIWSRDIIFSNVAKFNGEEVKTVLESELDNIKEIIQVQSFKEQRLAKFFKELVAVFKQKKMTEERDLVNQRERMRLDEIRKRVERTKKLLWEREEYESESEQEIEADEVSDPASDSDYFSEEEEVHDLHIPESVDVLKEEVDEMIIDVKKEMKSNMDACLEEIDPTPEVEILSKTFYKRSERLHDVLQKRRKLTYESYQKSREFTGYSFLESKKSSSADVNYETRKIKVFSKIENLKRSVDPFIDLKRIETKIESGVFPSIAKQNEVKKIVENEINRIEFKNRILKNDKEKKEGINQVPPEQLSREFLDSINNKSYLSIPVILPTTL